MSSYDLTSEATPYEYCDACSTGIEEGDGVGVETFLEEVMWKSKGEPGVLCQTCYKIVRFVPSIPDNEEGSPHVVTVDSSGDAGESR